MENPEIAQMKDKVCEDFTRPGPDSCSRTWNKIPGNR
jgi:hypothetical protein